MNVFWTAFIAVLALSGCSLQPIRTIQTPITNNIQCNRTLQDDRINCGTTDIYTISSKENAVSTHHQSSMYILEISDQGILINRDTAIELLRKIKKDMQNVDHHKPIVTLFVHGWNNNAEPNNSDLTNFEVAVNALKLAQPQPEKTPVHGIFVSWRGKTLPLGLSHALTFWDRKIVSEEIGRGDLTSLIFELELALKPNLKHNLIEDSQGTLILSGHSFGASALYNAIGHELLSRFYRSIKMQEVDKTQPIQGVGDIVILLNPAIQALRFKGLREVVYGKAGSNPNLFDNNKMPLFVMIATEDDFAVKTAFPIGRRVTTLFNHHPLQTIPIYNGILRNTLEVPVKKAEISSIGFYDNYYTHFIFPLENMLQGSHLYTLINAPSNLIHASPELLQAPKSMVQLPKEIIDKSLGLNKPYTNKNEVQTIGSCLSEKIIDIFSERDLKKLDIFDAIYKGYEGSETFYTEVPIKTLELSNSDNEQTDELIPLLKIQITNNPTTSLDTTPNWTLLQDAFKRVTGKDPKNSANQNIDAHLTWKRNPYWFMKARADFMQGHNGIWNKNLGCLMMLLMANKPIPQQLVQHIRPTKSKKTTTNKQESTDIKNEEAVKPFSSNEDQNQSSAVLSEPDLNQESSTLTEDNTGLHIN